MFNNKKNDVEKNPVTEELNVAGEEIKKEVKKVRKTFKERKREFAMNHPTACKVIKGVGEFVNTTIVVGGSAFLGAELYDLMTRDRKPKYITKEITPVVTTCVEEVEEVYPTEEEPVDVEEQN